MKISSKVLSDNGKALPVHENDRTFSHDEKNGVDEFGALNKSLISKFESENNLAHCEQPSDVARDWIRVEIIVVAEGS